METSGQVAAIYSVHKSRFIRPIRLLLVETKRSLSQIINPIKNLALNRSFFMCDGEWAIERSVGPVRSSMTRQCLYTV